MHPSAKPTGAIKKAPEKSTLKTSAAKAPVVFDASELKFFAEERPRLRIAQGITDPVHQNAELKRRYQEVKRRNHVGDGWRKEGQQGGGGYQEASGRSHPLAHSLWRRLDGPPRARARQHSPKQRRHHRTSTTTLRRPAPRRRARPPPSLGSADNDSDGESDGDSEMDAYEDIVIEHLMKLPKDLLKDMCKAYYGVEMSGSKQDLADLVAEQLTNVTGSDSDGDDEDA
ncbi:hypothetical protein CYMTET_3393 [Cymbomonas tetramitiformis]|uniref:SAP domain-containing protein n=1 Tax=Cymbomonas tetramitiformis TaxID=36881 RepID=A0AAE0H3J8_9CHLO|nr:hypothetical protein CYMTET_3393 [Cymbomonas tetramitiformis]